MRDLDALPFPVPRSDRHRSVSRRMEIGPRLFFAEYCCQPRLPVPVQLVRQTDLRRLILGAISGAAWQRKCGSLKHDFGAEHLWFADDIFGLQAEMGPRTCRRS